MTAASPGSAVDDAFVGALLDARYRVTGLIGRGGVATVYRATDTVLGREVAIKVFRGAEGLDDPERRRSETALLASLAHPSLVMLHDSVHEAGTGREFLVMELVEGPNLRERLDAQGPLGAREAATMTVELAEALHVIHGRGIVHRDVKPANVLLAPSPVPTHAWRAKLADFGIARLVDDAHLTATGGLIGTPAYLAPEQVRGLGAGPGSDIYALGLLLLESRTGRAAFPGPAIESASARLTRDPELPAFLGADWRGLLAAMLAREPGDRPTSLEVAVAAAALGPDTRSAEGRAGAPTTPSAAEPVRRATSGASAPPVGARSSRGGAPPDGHGRADASGGARPPGDADRADDTDPADDTAQLAASELDDRGEAPTMLLGNANAPGQAPAHARPPAGRTGLRASSAESAPAEVARADTRGAAAGAGARGRASAGAGAGAADGRRRRVWLIPVGAIAALAVAVAIVVPMMLSGTGGGDAEPTPAPMPSVPGELGVHLEELEEAVTP